MGYNGYEHEREQKRNTVRNKTRLTTLTLALIVFLAIGAHSVVADDRVLADFEGTDYGGWRATGDAFGPAPARGTLPHQQSVSGYAGAALVNSYRGGDNATGTLTSPPFTVDRRYLNFLIGGGDRPVDACLNLL